MRFIFNNSLFKKNRQLVFNANPVVPSISHAVVIDKVFVGCVLIVKSVSRNFGEFHKFVFLQQCRNVIFFMMGGFVFLHKEFEELGL